jgi:hypothetical protein
MGRLRVWLVAPLAIGCSSAPSAQALGAGDAGDDAAPAGDDAAIVYEAGRDAGPGIDATTDAGGACPPVSGLAPVLTYDLRSAPFPDASSPSVAVHVPDGFDPSNRPGVIVFFHGFDNCIQNVVGSVDSPCTEGGAPRDALHLVDQLDAARVNAILVAVETEVDVAAGNPGQLTTPGDFRALLHELLTEHLDAAIGCQLDVGDLDRVVVSSHSGGYEAAANAISVGMVPEVREVDLLDSLYGYTAVFDEWVGASAVRFDPARTDGLRWMDIYTQTGGTAANSRAMAVAAEGWLAEAGLDGSELFDDTIDVLEAGAYAHPVVFKLTGLAHGDVPKVYFGELARESGFATIP